MQLRLTVLAFALLVSAAASAATLRQIENVAWNFTRVSPGGLAIADFSGNGVLEAVLTTAAGSPLLVTLGRDGSAWRVVNALPIESSSDILLAQPWRRDGKSALVVVEGGYWWSSGTRQAFVFEGWPLRQTQAFAIEDASGARVADADGDGEQELLVTTSTHTYAYSLPSGALLWSIAAGGADVHVASFSGVDAPQIIIAGQPGRVFDGVTRLQTWSYPDGFGATLTSGRFAADGSVQFVGAQDWNPLTVYRAAPWSPVWDLARFDIDAVGAADFDGDGIDELLVGDSQWGNVSVIDTLTRLPRVQAQNPGHGIAALAAGDLTGNGVPELVFAPRSDSYSNEPVLRIASGTSGATLFDLQTREGGVGALALGPLSGDGRDKLVTASTVRGMSIRDVATGTVEFEEPGSLWNYNDPFSMTIHTVQRTAPDHLGRHRLVFAGTRSYFGRIVVFDPASQSVTRQIGDVSTSNPMSDRAITGSELFDFDGDGQEDIVVSTGAATTLASGARLHVFSLQTGALLWESVSMGGGVAGSRGLLLVPGKDGQPTLMIAALSNGLRAFDASTGLLAWTLDASTQTAAWLPDAPDGAEFVIAGGDGIVRHFDATTRTLRQSYPLAHAHHIHPLPGGEALVMRAQGRLVIVDHAGNELARSTRIGNETQHTTIQSRERHGVVEIFAGTHHGYARYRFNAKAIFEDGFE